MFKSVVLNVWSLIVGVVWSAGPSHVRPTFSSDMSLFSTIITSYISASGRLLYLWTCLLLSVTAIVWPLKIISIILIRISIAIVPWVIWSSVSIVALKSRLIVGIRPFVAVGIPVMRWTSVPATWVAAISSLLAWKAGVPTLRWWWSRKLHSWVSSGMTV